MKSYKKLYDQVYAFSNLLRAADKARKGKRRKPYVARFDFHLEEELLRLESELRNRTYTPGPYTEFLIFEPKIRLISAAPYRDRVVHHALIQVIEPLFERTFIHDSYACRVGKGTHRAVNRFTQFCRQNKYVLKCDIQKYFPSIDHDVLYGMLCKRIVDTDVRWLIKTILDNSNPQEPVLQYFPQDTDLFTPLRRCRGIPIGNLTSQFFANVYLNGFDHYVKEALGCKYYIRYCDDFTIFDNRAARLRDVKEALQAYLATLRLKMHPKKCRIARVAQGTNFLGYRIFPTYRRLRPDNVRRFIRKLRCFQECYRRGEMSWEEIRQSVYSWIAHASHADSWHLREDIFAEAVFRREAGRFVVDS
jgi:retron-type reverse transcriptase